MSQMRSRSHFFVTRLMGWQTILSVAFVLLASGCDVQSNSGGSGGDAVGSDTGAGGQTCKAVATNINYATGGGPGSWTNAGAICSGLTDIYSVNVGCSGPSKPACGTCNVSGKLTYDSKDANLVLEIYDENGQAVQATSAEGASPKTATAPVKYGGTFSVRVRNASGPQTSYSLVSTYSCP
jgi:hypothetical protein